MPLLSNVLGFGFVGVLARVMQVGITGRPLSYRPAGYAYSVLFFSTLGLGFTQFEDWKSTFVAAQRAKLAAAAEE
ncbi:uncharacterized protein V1510DRAFT_428615 [Dipodascopsis tothii]|uniref:uncharacterized protein n=1 Tax=Dipodascopsis tothii TaxID=44089 RepID=UPI0034CF1AC2